MLFVVGYAHGIYRYKLDIYVLDLVAFFVFCIS